MGACASKFGVLKGAADAAPPEEVGSRDLNQNIDKKDGKSEVPAGDESKHQLLGNLLKENEGKDSTFESSGKLSEAVKLEGTPVENENVKSSEPVCDDPAKGADTVVGSVIPVESKAVDENQVKLSEQTVEPMPALEKEAGVEHAEMPKFEECKPTLETEKDLVKMSIVEDRKPDDLVETRNIVTLDCKKIEDQQPDFVVEKVILEISDKKPEEQAGKEGNKEPSEHPNTVVDKCGEDTAEVKTSLS